MKICLKRYSDKIILPLRRNLPAGRQVCAFFKFKFNLSLRGASATKQSLVKIHAHAIKPEIASSLITLRFIHFSQ
jgi:hypothetical protein